MTRIKKTAILEYIWIDGYLKDTKRVPLRSKIRCITGGCSPGDILSNNKYMWNYDGSSTNQATTENSEIILFPVAVYHNPFYREYDTSYLVLCTTSHTNSESRKKCVDVMNKIRIKPRFGFEQEFFLVNDSIDKAACTLQSGIVGKLSSIPSQESQHYYCSTNGLQKDIRKFMDSAMEYLIYAGIHISGYNLEVAPSQGEFQLDSFGIDACDQLWIMRYILTRIAEKNGFSISLHPKHFKGTVNGSGLHTNFSIPKMMGDTDMKFITKLLDEHISLSHVYDMKHYGSGNDMRMSGSCETAKYDSFSYGVSDRSASIRIPSNTELNGRGYIEDRRPSSNADPYAVSSIITNHLINCMKK